MRLPGVYKFVGFALASLGLLPLGCTGSVLLATSPDAATSSNTSVSSGGASTGTGLSPGSSTTSTGAVNATTTSTSTNSDTSTGANSATLSDGAADDAPVVDAAPLVLDDAPDDAAVAIDVMAPAGLSGFAFVVNGVVQTPLACLVDDWEFAPVPGMGGQTTCPGPGPGSLCNVGEVVLANTGQVPLAYLAAAVWELPFPFRPGVLTGSSGQLAGVLPPGGQVNITSVFAGGYVALVGASEPFSQPDANYAGDEGTVPWPGGVAGSNGSTQMWIAQIEMESACTTEPQIW